jgi:membrane dipeptidase
VTNIRFEAIGQRAVSLTLLAAVAAIAQGGAAWASPVTPDAAKAVQNSLITLDTHLDTPANFARPGWDMLDRHKVEDRSQVDYPRMVEGGLKGGFFAVYTPQGPRTPAGDLSARDAALIRAMEIHEMVARHGAEFALALKADDAAAIDAKGKRFVFMSIENSYPLEGDLSLMATFQKLGVRLIGPAHFKNNDLADSATDTPEWHGLSPKGKIFVAEANRLGLMLDASHSSDEVLDQMMALSKTPIVLSHSGCKAVFDHPRNIDDAHLRALAANGGVIQVNTFSSYLIPTPKNPDRDAAMAALMKKAEGPMTPEKEAALRTEMRTIETKYPTPKATFEDFMNHLNHALKVAGVDHVGIGADMDGGGGVVGMEDVSGYWKITQRLMEEGYTREDLAKIWGGNLLRIMRQAEAYKASLATH